MVYKKKLLASPSGEHWKRIGFNPRHGFVAPLFCLRSKKSCGIGEYTDLLPLIDWCKQIGFSIIQLLPINDTAIHTSPYAAISAFALNPIHLGLASLPSVNKHPALVKQIEALQKMTTTPRVDYPPLHKKREKFLRSYYKLEGERIKRAKKYKEFLKEHEWLEGHALFKTIKEKTGWKSIKEWPKDIDPDDYRDEIAYHNFVQFLCFQQMHHIEEIAWKKGVLLMGDIPILIGRESAEVWQHPKLFKLQYAAGAPPDLFAKDGQNWGFPIYNWQELEKTDYHWWRRRLEVASLFFDIYRIDHVIGFYRIWAIPKGLLGRKGHYIPDHSRTWLMRGKKNISMMLDSTLMFPIGEDLGFIPENVFKSLRDFGIPGMKIMRWERNWKGDKSFIPFKKYGELSMTTVTTHDMEPLVVWWKRKPDEAKEFCRFAGWEYEPKLSLEKHEEFLLMSHRTPSLFRINMIQEYLSLVPELAWSNPEQDRVNTPGTVSPMNWSNRLRPWIEELVKSRKLKTIMKKMSGT